MKTIRFNAPAHHTLLVGDRVIAGGTTVALPDDQADELLTAPYVDMTEVEENLGALDRGALDEFAGQAGVEDPAALPNKNAVIAAINEPQAEAAGDIAYDNDKED